MLAQAGGPYKGGFLIRDQNITRSSRFTLFFVAKQYFAVSFWVKIHNFPSIRPSFPPRCFPVSEIFSRRASWPGLSTTNRQCGPL